MPVNHERTSNASLPSEFHGERAIGQDEPYAARFEHHCSIGPPQPDGQHPIAVDLTRRLSDGRVPSIRYGHVAGYQRSCAWDWVLPLDGTTRNQQRQNETDVETHRAPSTLILRDSIEVRRYPFGDWGR